MNLDSLYLYLLNRKPNMLERKKHKHIDLKLVNNEIVKGSEYQQFTKKTYQEITNKILSVLEEYGCILNK